MRAVDLHPGRNGTRTSCASRLGIRSNIWRISAFRRRRRRSSRWCPAKVVPSEQQSLAARSIVISGRCREGTPCMLATTLSGERKQLSLRVKHSSRFELQAGDDQAAQYGAWRWAIGGSAAIVAGLILVTGPCTFRRSVSMRTARADASADAAAAGLALLLGGAHRDAHWLVHVRPAIARALKRIDERSYQATETTSQVRVGLVGLGSRRARARRRGHVLTSVAAALRAASSQRLRSRPPA